MNDTRQPPGTVNRDVPGVYWRERNSPARHQHNFLCAQALSLWTRLQRSLHSRGVRRLRVRETLALGEKRQLLIVECGERQLLIGAAGNFLTMLAELPVVEHSRDTGCE